MLTNGGMIKPKYAMILAIFQNRKKYRNTSKLHVKHVMLTLFKYERKYSIDFVFFKEANI